MGLSGRGRTAGSFPRAGPGCRRTSLYLLIDCKVRVCGFPLSTQEIWGYKISLQVKQGKNKNSSCYLAYHCQRSVRRQRASSRPPEDRFPPTSPASLAAHAQPAEEVSSCFLSREKKKKKNCANQSPPYLGSVSLGRMARSCDCCWKAAEGRVAPAKLKNAPHRQEPGLLLPLIQG